MGRCKGLGSLKSFLWYDLSYLGPVSCVFIACVSSGFTVRGGCSLMATRWQVFFVSFLGSLRAHWLTLGYGCTLWGLWHLLFFKKLPRWWYYSPKEARGNNISICMIKVKGVVYAAMHAFYRSLLLVLWRLLLVTRSRHPHHEGFQCSCRFKEMQELGS